MEDPQKNETEHFICSRCKRLCEGTQIAFVEGRAVCHTCNGAAPEAAKKCAPQKDKEKPPPKHIQQPPAKSLLPPRETPKGASFFEAFPHAFAFPLTGGGITRIIVGGIFFWVAMLVASLSFFGIFLALIIAGYLCAYMVKIINAVAAGAVKLPDWPEFTDMWDSVIHPFLLVVATTVMAFAPLLIYALVLVPRGAPMIVAPFLILYALIYQPMGLLSISIHNSFTALNPLFVMASIFRVPLIYLVTLLALCILIVIRQVMMSMVMTFIPLAGSALASVLSLYFLAVHMYILGTIYRTSQEKLRW
jgi:hypothetical protein